MKNVENICVKLEAQKHSSEFIDGVKLSLNCLRMSDVRCSPLLPCVAEIQ